MGSIIWPSICCEENFKNIQCISTILLWYILPWIGAWPFTRANLNSLQSSICLNWPMSLGGKVNGKERKTDNKPWLEKYSLDEPKRENIAKPLWTFYFSPTFSWLMTFYFWPTFSGLMTFYFWLTFSRLMTFYFDHLFLWHLIFDQPFLDLWDFIFDQPFLIQPDLYHSRPGQTFSPPMAISQDIEFLLKNAYQFYAKSNFFLFVICFVNSNHCFIFFPWYMYLRLKPFKWRSSELFKCMHS